MTREEKIKYKDENIKIKEDEKKNWQVIRELDKEWWKLTNFEIQERLQNKFGVAE